MSISEKFYPTIVITPELLDPESDTGPSEEDINQELERISSRYSTKIFWRYHISKITSTLFSCYGLFISFSLMIPCLYLFSLFWHQSYYISTRDTQYYDSDEEFNRAMVFIKIYIGGLIILFSLLLIDCLCSSIIFCAIGNIIGKVLIWFLGCYEIIFALILLILGIGFICFFPIYDIVYIVCYFKDCDHIGGEGTDFLVPTLAFIIVLILMCVCIICYGSSLLFGVFFLCNDNLSIRFSLDKEYRENYIKTFIKEKYENGRKELKSKEEELLKLRKERERGGPELEMRPLNGGQLFIPFVHKKPSRSDMGRDYGNPEFDTFQKTGRLKDLPTRSQAGYRIKGFK